MSNFLAKYAQCPYYKDEEKHSIKCDGWLADHNIQQKFGRTDDKEDFAEGYCRTMRFTECPLYKMLTEEIEGDSYD